MKKTAVYKPQGHQTRGKTARNRLRRTDIFMLLTEGPLIRMQDEPGRPSFYVDLGYGFEPFTTLEAADRLRVQNPNLPVLGDRKSTRLNSSHPTTSRMPSSA